MKDKDFEARFPWTLAFLISSVCYFGFIGVMKLMNIVLPPLFMWTGIISLSLTCFSGILSFLAKRKHMNASGINDDRYK